MNITDFPVSTASGADDVVFESGFVKDGRWYCACPIHSTVPTGRTLRCRLGLHKKVGAAHVPGTGFAALGTAWFYVCTRCGNVSL